MEDDRRRVLGLIGALREISGLISSAATSGWNRGLWQSPRAQADASSISRSPLDGRSCRCSMAGHELFVDRLNVHRQLRLVRAASLQLGVSAQPI